MIRTVKTALCVAMLAVAWLAIDPYILAYAADAASSGATSVTWHYGATVSEWAGAIGTALLAVAMWAIRKLPAQIVAILLTMRADQILQTAIDYGITAVKGATRDKTLTVEVGNQVLAEAAQYIIDNAPAWLQAWLGGPDQIVKKLFARLNLPAESFAPATSVVVAQVTQPAA